MVFINAQSITSAINAQRQLSLDITDLQTQVSSEKNFQAPSDDPQAWLQISGIGRQQQLNASYQSNATYATSRATQASSSLSDVNNLMTQVTNLLVTANSTAAGSPGAIALAQELSGIKDSITAIMTQTDYQGTPTFDDTNPVSVPVGQGLTMQAVMTRQSVTDGITTAGGTKTIYDVLDDAIAAVQSGDNTQQGTALAEAHAALDHVIVAESGQGVLSTRISDQATRLQDQSVNLTESRSNLEDVDISSVVTKLQTKMTTLQAAQAVFVKINSKSLFDLIS